MGLGGVFMDKDKANAFVQELAKLANGRPAFIERKATYPCLISNSKSGAPPLKIEPLIGTADEALYLRLSDIKKLGLEDTGKTVETRQGDCKIFKGDISFTFPNDYNGGTYTYRSQYAYCLSPDITENLRADFGKNNKKHGIIGVTLLHRHVTFVHRIDMHVIDLDKLPPFARFFTSAFQQNPRIEKHPDTGESMMTFDRFQDLTLEDCLALARARPDPPFNYFSPKPLDTTFIVLEECRTCSKTDSKESKLFRCSLCSSEKRSRSALYCSKECQRVDWKARHKEEHNGVREWDMGTTL
ncbi:hypothetical protein VNI00_012511 [Paramarasmius palmivorus]|uniref:MYND-type domain-containing protein n=1 Tax=Paramarasmius palmivorus TaxID=297713 RepID=A0AAW0C616_9AGAR